MKTAHGQDRPCGLMSTDEALAIIGALFKWLYDEPLTNPERQAAQLSIIACIVCDSTSGDIRCQPLHDAYAEHKRTRGIK